MYNISNVISVGTFKLNTYVTHDYDCLMHASKNKV